MSLRAQDSEEPGSSPRQSQGVMSKKRNSKRSWPEPDEWDIGEDENTTAVQPKRRFLEPKSPHVSWSCPFWKRAPTHHMDCMSYTLRRIPDVKQHLIRKHFQSPYYCPVCQKQFGDTAARDLHIRKRKCVKTSPGELDGLTPIPHKKQTMLRVRMSGTDVQIWYQIWTILFEKEPPPESPYQKTIVEEVAELLQQSWRDHQSEILHDITPGNFGDANFDLARAQIPSLFSSALSRLVDVVQGTIHNTPVGSSESTSSKSDTSGTSASREASLVPFLKDSSLQMPDTYHLDEFLGCQLKLGVGDGGWRLSEAPNSELDVRVNLYSPPPPSLMNPLLDSRYMDTYPIGFEEYPQDSYQQLELSSHSLFEEMREW
ncbi:hypothetical protein QBC41DRAFT_315235 [Cercophora samala]|uniref:C2H2-type domain-containing protein n=1 Tax=Cercophora samala TaxID=330535 RepID=A0AA39ZIF7_9PEZI|nr:hypothetical protein QBC41DRAFT_315235 [Cercophora samala]